MSINDKKHINWRDLALNGGGFRVHHDLTWGFGGDVAVTKAALEFFKVLNKEVIVPTQQAHADGEADWENIAIAKNAEFLIEFIADALSLGDWENMTPEALALFGYGPEEEEDYPEPDSMAIQEGAMNHQDDEITAQDAFKYPSQRNRNEHNA